MTRPMVRALLIATRLLYSIIFVFYKGQACGKRACPFLKYFYMAFVHPELNHQARLHPQTNYSVLITLKGTTLPSELTGKGQFVLANKIFSATISGQEIQSFANNEEVEAIEPDAEMRIT